MANFEWDVSRAGQEWTVTSAHFGLEITGITGKGELGRFQKVSGLGVSVETEDVVEGGQNQFVRKLPGRMKWDDLQLERGIIFTDKLLEWLQECSGRLLEGKPAPRRDGVIVMYGANNKPLRKWEFSGAFPVSWTGPSFDADSDNVTTEKLVITHDGLKPTH